MMDNMMHVSPSPAPENRCRRAAFSHGTNTVIIRRKRLKLRRLITTELAGDVVVHGQHHCTKRKRTADTTKEEFSKKKTSAMSNKIKNEIITNGSVNLVISKEDSEREKDNRFTCWSHGSISVIGRRREMEDAVAIQLEFLKNGPKKYDFFGVYDGHGGSRVAHACRERLHHWIVKTVGEEEVEENGRRAEEQKIDWEKVMAASFRRMDEEVNKGDSSAEMIGSTAVVAVVGEEELVVANCGDSRAVLFRDGVALPLSHDHKPDRPDELERIEESGGKVINWEGQRVLGVLATSRSIGDHYLKPFVTAEPEVRIINRSDKDEFLILACDGLWDVISNDIACNVVRRCLLHNSQRGSSFDEAAEILAELAIARGSRDNISVIVIELKKFRRSRTKLIIRDNKL